MICQLDVKLAEYPEKVSFSPWLPEFLRYTSAFLSGLDMPFTVTESLTKLRSNLEITFPQAATVSTQQQNIRAAINSGLVVEDFLTGYWALSTMISPLKEAPAAN